MAKIPFDIKYRPQIECGEYKVETGNGYPVTIYRWDFKDKENTPILGSYIFEDGTEYCAGWSNEGCFSLYGESDVLDLFLITPEPELTEFEKKLSDVVGYAISLSVAEPKKPTSEFVKEYAAELLDLANKELKKHEFAIFTREEFDAEIEKAKAEALKDLPRWRKWRIGAYGNGRGIPLAIAKRGLNGYKLVDALGIPGEQYIMLSDLEKLPGFKEDSHE